MPVLIPASRLIDLFQRMYKEHWAYAPGAARQGCVDCSGAFVWAYGQFGLSIYHGSNRIAREYVVQLLPPSMAQPGMAAFKAYRADQPNWDLPAEYQPGGKRYNGDVQDYYHIGLVDENPEYVINAASTQLGVVRSKLRNGWCAVGYLKAVQYENSPETGGKDELMAKATVISFNGGKVNLRAEPDLNGALVNRLTPGTEVQIIKDMGNWAYVSTTGDKKQSGFIMSEFLSPAEPEANETPEAPAGDGLDDLREMAARMKALAEDMLARLSAAG